ncbi:phage major capsid protein [Eubacteriales bacterium OttesenSCG-928-N13]|nr:phage major capsid protein [Eubacteriales bacterium OttesenSCG-928-N13]
MNQILALREKRAKAWDAAKAFLDTKRAQDGTLSAEDAATYDRMEADVVNLGKEVERLERQAAIDRELDQPTGKPLTDKPQTLDGKAKTGRASDEYKTAFWNVMRNKSVPHEIYNALQVGTDSEGGYLVPDEYERTLIEALEEQNIFRQLAKVITTSSGDRKIPVVVSKGSAAWIDEEAAYPESDDVFGQTSIGAYKLATMIKVSDELLHDSVFDVASYIAKEFARRIGAAEEEAFFTGNGTGKPLGILAATGGAQTGVTTASATAIAMDEVMDLFYSLRAPYRRNSVFIMNDSTVKALRKLKNGNGDYIWQPSVVAGTPDTLLNRPVYTSTFMPTIAASAKTILFGDLGYYWVADREGRKFQRLNELYAPTGQVGFLSSERVDGKLILPEAVKTLEMKTT